MLKNVTIKRMVIFSIGILLLSIVIMGLTSISTSKAIANQTAVLYNKPHTNLLKMKQVEITALRVSNALRGSVLEGNNGANTVRGYLTDIETLMQEIEANKVKVGPMDPAMTKAMQTLDVWSQEIEQMLSKLATQDFQGTYALMDADFLAKETEVIQSIEALVETATTNANIFKDNAGAMALQVRIVLTIIFLASVLIAVWALFFILKAIDKPLREISKVTDGFARGELSKRVDYDHRNEFGTIATGINQVLAMVNQYIDNLTFVMGKVANSDLTVNIDIEYIGDFSAIKDSIERILGSLQHTVSNIHVTADQVAVGSEQVAASAQMLAQSTTEQASAVEDLSDSIGAISSHINQNAENARKASSSSHESMLVTANSNERMQQLMAAMTDINLRSAEIGKIIKTIDDIAFQTNILALNAAVEAARAGVAGKGFAVVADEVRNLAGKSAVAAANTTELIEASIEAINEGARLADGTAQEMLLVVEGVKDTTALIAEISRATDEQVRALSNITLGIDQISSTVQSNSATAEQSAASSEELSSQAIALSELVGHFQLKQKNPTLYAPSQAPLQEESAAFSGNFDKY